MNYAFRALFDVKHIFNIQLLLNVTLSVLNHLTRSFIYDFEPIASKDYL